MTLVTELRAHPIFEGNSAELIRPLRRTKGGTGKKDDAADLMSANQDRFIIRSYYGKNSVAADRATMLIRSPIKRVDVPPAKKWEASVV